MTDKSSRHRYVDILAVLLLFLVFSMTALLLVLSGAGVYEKTAARMKSSFTTRTALSYLIEKIHENDASGVISVSELDGNGLLAFRFSENGTSYCTWIYLSDGSLKELTARISSSSEQDPGQASLTDSPSFRPDAGQTLLSASSFTAEENNGLITLSVTDSDGVSESAAVAKRSGK
ncbi:MAG TPA: DUF4860 domain-containing protein [Lachnospiraceae bacterium]|nr:DUF4860 domain-containing protein [Lachnospiraceae bacterium]